MTLWVGGMWFAGYVVAPVLFQLLDKKTAGAVAGQVFSITSYIGLVCGGVLLLSLLLSPHASRLKNYRIWALILMLLIIVIGQFLLSPMMTELKLVGLDGNPDVAASFAKLHGVSSSLFLVNSLLGLALVVAGLRPDRNQD